MSLHSLGGGRALRMIPTTVRVVCNNTLNLALNRASSSEGICIYHFGNLSDRVNRARDALGIVVKRFEQFEEEANALAARKMESGEACAYFESLLPSAPSSKSGQTLRSKTLDAMIANYMNDKQSLPGVKGTAWAAYNAVSEWADHQKRVIGQGDARLDNQLNSIWFGSANTLKQRAFEDALALAS